MQQGVLKGLLVLMLQLPHQEIDSKILHFNRVGILIQRGLGASETSRQTLEVLGKLEGLCS